MILQVELTNGCNYRCTLCPQAYWRADGGTPRGNPFDRARGSITPELFKLALDNAQKYADTVTLGYFGEPTMHLQFEELLELVPPRRHRRYRINTFTNFALATLGTMRALRRLDNVRISVDAATSATYETVRPGGSVLGLHGEVCPQTERFAALSAKIEHWLGEPHPDTTLMFVRSSLNRHEQQAFLDRWRPRLMPHDSCVTKTVVSYGGCIADECVGVNPCNVPNEPRITVAWNGDLTPCNLDVNVAIKVGNLLEERDVGSVMNSRRFRDALGAMRKGEGICANCPDANNHTETRIHRS